MNRIESVANAGVEMDTLKVNEQVAAPVLTPVAVTVTAVAAGAGVGYVQQARHGDIVDESRMGVRATGDIRDMSVGELLQARNDAL